MRFDALFGFGLGLVFDLLDLDGGGLLRLVDDLRHQLLARVVGGHAGQLLQLGLRFVEQLLGAPGRRFGGLLTAGDGLLFLLELGFAALEGAGLLGQLLFAPALRLFGLLQLDATLLELVGSLGLGLERELFGLELRRAFYLGRLRARGVDELLALGFGYGRLLFAKHHHPGDDADD